MKKGVMIAIGVAIAIVIIGVVFGLTGNTEKETKLTQNSTNVTPPTPIQGKNFSVNLSENVGIGAH